MPFGFKTVRELVSDLTIRVRELETEVKAIGQEWDETYDKMTRKQARDRKRLRDEAEGGGPGSGQSENRPDTTSNIPRSILARRRHGNGRDAAAPDS